LTSAKDICYNSFEVEISLTSNYLKENKMLVTRFDPFRELANMQRVFSSYPAHTSDDTSISAFTPQINTREGEFAYHIDVDVPGVKKEDISIDFDNGKLTISGERNLKEEVKEEDYHKVETSFGKFQRLFTLPENVDTENITASSQNGVLEVVIPKIQKEDTVKKIEIK
jgi:HSP20 family protein